MIETDKSLVRLGLRAKDSEAVIRSLCAMLEAQGKIGPDYCQAVLEREKLYPTGLPSEGAIAAIPHAFSADVRETAMAVAILAEPVPFRNISDYDEELPVEVVFLLANGTDADGHMDTLQELMACISRPQMLRDICKAQCPEDVVEILRQADRYPEE